MSSETGVASGSERTTLRLTATGFEVSTWISDVFSASVPPNAETIVPVRLSDTVVFVFA